MKLIVYYFGTVVKNTSDMISSVVDNLVSMRQYS